MGPSCSYGYSVSVVTVLVTVLVLVLVLVPGLRMTEDELTDILLLVGQTTRRRDAVL